MAIHAKRFLTVFGTRPEAIKMAPVITELRRRGRDEVIVCVTGQHRQMLDQVLNVFDIAPDFDLEVMRENQQLGELAGRIIMDVQRVIKAAEPDRVLVHGDTITTFAASLAAFYEQVPVGHVEAGLRTGDLMAPWPEEANRKLTGVLADLHFAPTEQAKQNLLREGVAEDAIYVTGNTVVDALLSIRDKLAASTELRNACADQFAFLNSDVPLIVVTGHRRESFSGGLQRMCTALAEIAAKESVDIVYPVHLNPEVRRAAYGCLQGYGNIHLIEPLEYLPFLYLLMKATLVITDSGGIQEEGPSLGIPVLVTRDVTERPEGLSTGAIRLVGTNTEKIVSTTTELLLESIDDRRPATAANPYGDGHASERISDVLSGQR